MTSPPPAASRPQILGVRIDSLRREDLLARVTHGARSRLSLTVMYVNAHRMNVQHSDGAYRNILD